MCNPWKLLKDNADPIMVLVTVAGFGLTIWQLSAAGSALRASNSYEIQRDSRELIGSMLSDQEFRDYVGNNGPLTQKSLDKLWLIFGFYRSIYRQQEVGGLLDEYANSIKDEFCGFVGGAPVDEGWKRLLSEKRIGDGHVQMRKTWCLGG
jgi:hypothetical protein